MARLSDGSDNADSENWSEKLILEFSRLAVLENGLGGVDSTEGGGAKLASLSCDNVDKSWTGVGGMWSSLEP